MFDSIIAFSLKRRVVVIMGTLLLIAAGLYAFTILPIDAVPDITNNQVQILTKAPALSPYEVEQFITFPIEVAVKPIPHIVELRSTSKAGLSVVTVVFEDDVDIYFARQQILEKLREAESQMPDGVEKPELGPVSTGLGEIFRYVVKDTTGKLSAMDLRTVQDWIVRRQLLGTTGVVEVNTLGGELKQYQVLVDPDALVNYGLTFREVFEAASKSSANAGGAYIESGEEQYSVRSVGLATSVEDIQSTVIRTSNDGTPIKIGDVAQVVIGPSIRFGSASQDGKGEVVTGITMQLMGANARVIVSAVKERIEEIKPSLPPGVVIEPYYDRQVLINRTIKTVVTNLIEGALLVIAVLLIFLANLRAGFILASVIPLSMMFAAIMMVLTGQTGNLMSLGAIDFGLVVDGSLIIIENCLRLVSERLQKSNGKEITSESLRKIVYAGSVEVRKAAQFGEIIIIIVYLPILTLQGIEGKFFRPMALTVGFALIGALILSLTYVPMMASFFFKRKGVIRESPVILWLHKLYGPLLKRALVARKLILGGVLLLFIVSIFIFTRMGGEFIPKLDEGDIALHLIRLPSVSLSESQKITTRAEQEIMKFSEVKTVVSHTGRAEISTDPMGVELADVFVMLHPYDEWTTGRDKAQFIKALNEKLEMIPGTGVQFLQPIEMRMNELIAGARGDVVIKIFGEDYKVLTKIAQDLTGILNSTKGGADVTFEQTSGQPQLNIKPNHASLSRYGLTVKDVTEIVETALGGKEAAQVFEGEKRFDIVVRYTPTARSSPEAISNILISTPTGQRIPLSTVADIGFESGPSNISRENGYRYLIVQSNVRDRDIESFVEEVQKKVGTVITIPSGYNISYGGQFKNLQEASNRLTIVVPIALFLIYLLLYQTFKSFRLGLMILLCVPMATIGGIAALLIAGMPFSISAGVGFIALFGVAVLNGIVMIAAIRKFLQEGFSRRESIFRGAEERMRPVVTTAALAAFGFVPMLLANGAGAEVQRPLAAVIIGGLISSTLLTLFVLPIVFDWAGGESFPADTEEDADDILEKDDTAQNDSSSISVITKVASILLLVCCGISCFSNVQAQGTPKVITLAQAHERAINYNATIKRSIAAIDRQKGLGGASVALPPTDLFYRGEDIPNSGSWNQGKTSFGIGQSFDFPLAYGARSSAASAGVNVAEATLNEIILEVKNEVRRRYVDALVAKARLELGDSAVIITQKLNDISRVRSEVGDISPLESQQVSLTYTIELQRRTLLRNDYQVRIRDLARLIGETDSIVIEGKLELPTKTYTLDSLMEQLKSRHPSLLRADASVESARAQKTVISYELLPSFGLEYSRVQLAGIAGYYSAMLRMSVPIYRWFNRGADNAASAQISFEQAEYDATYQLLSRSTEAALLQYQNVQSLLQEYLENILPQTEQVYRSVLRLYEEGQSSYLEVLTAQSNLLDTRKNFLELLYQTVQVQTELESITNP